MLLRNKWHYSKIPRNYSEEEVKNHKADRHLSQTNENKNQKLKCDICGKVHW